MKTTKKISKKLTPNEVATLLVAAVGLSGKKSTVLFNVDPIPTPETCLPQYVLTDVTITYEEELPE